MPFHFQQVFSIPSGGLPAKRHSPLVTPDVHAPHPKLHKDTTDKQLNLQRDPRRTEHPWGKSYVRVIMYSSKPPPLDLRHQYNASLQIHIMHRVSLSQPSHTPCSPFKTHSESHLLQAWKTGVMIHTSIASQGHSWVASPAT